MVRDATTGRTLAISGATMVHVELPADCTDQKSNPNCGKPTAPVANDADKTAETAPALSGNASRGP
jgi:hypothetical protein